VDPERDVVFGHEFCCEVVDHGPGTDKRLKLGTLVCSMPMTIAGNTVLGIGYSNDVAGGFAQYVPLAERLLWRCRTVSRPLTPRSLSRFNGGFRLTVPIGNETRMLPGEIRRLAVLRYVAQGKPAGSRWQRIFARWVASQAGKVRALGGNPDQVPPSLTDPQGMAEPGIETGEVTGKVRCLLYDCFGDFEGFDLENCTECHHFTTGERGIEEIIRRACQDRSWVKVLFDEDSRRILGIVIECTHHRS